MYTPVWLACWVPVIDRSRGSKSAEVGRTRDIYDDRLQVIVVQDSVDDVTAARLVWSRAADAALVGAYNAAGGTSPLAGLADGH